MNSFTHFADAKTPAPGVKWISFNERDRVDLIVATLKKSSTNFLAQIRVLAAKTDGQVVIQMRESLPANQRGTFLLDLEEYLKTEIDDALTVWLEPLGDRNSLRNLRGIKVKTEANRA